MADTTLKSAPGPSDVSQYQRTRTFQQAGTFANQNAYDPTAEGSFELKSKLYSDPAAYSFAINNWVSSWRNSSNVPNSNFKNELDYIQFLLRASGLSSEKGGLSRGVLTVKDLDGLKKASTIALANGVSFKDVMLSIYQSKQSGAGGAEGGPKYSKQIATSLRLLDLGDAQNKLSTAYFNMFGVYPTQDNINSFKDYWNAEARKQVATTTTSQVVQKGKVTVGKQTGTGTITTSPTEVVGEGFTEAEQAQTMANYLAKQFNIDPSKMVLGGGVKRIYDGIREIYRNNLLPEPSFETVASTVKDLLTTPDETSYNTKLASLQQNIRNKAAKFYPALATELANGQSVKDFSDVYGSLIAKKWGYSSYNELQDDPEATALIQSALNFTDSKGNVRLAKIDEVMAMAQKSKRWMNSPEALASFGDLGDKIIAAMGGGR